MMKFRRRTLVALLAYLVFGALKRFGGGVDAARDGIGDRFGSVAGQGISER